uniref:Uncharacterized protein n=1 Tax=Daphnia galeata TaxID=27404 RepID=A0A8J2WLV4_9CRUS|nr:unnamed protein product [Daphnia galeata]
MHRISANYTSNELDYSFSNIRCIARNTGLLRHNINRSLGLAPVAALPNRMCVAELSSRFGKSCRIDKTRFAESFLPNRHGFQ